MKMLFKELLDVAERRGTQMEKIACLCLPAWVSKKAINISRDAARQSGFKIVSVILQPTAACLAYDLLKERSLSTLVLTIHMGETSNVAALLEINGGLCTVRDTAYSDDKPGVSITNLLVEMLAKDFYNKFRCDALESKRSRQKLFNASNALKHTLSKVHQGKIEVECLGDGIDFQCAVSRVRADAAIKSAVYSLLQPALGMLAKNSIECGQIGKVILSGGTCCIPLLQNHVSSTFKNAEVLSSIAPDEVLACGAAVEAALVTQNFNQSNGTATPISNGHVETETRNGGKKKKKNKNGAEKKSTEPVRSHLPEVLSTLSLNIWAKVSF